MSKARETPISEIVGMTHEEACNDGNSWNFFDWFCETKSLAGRSKRLLGALRAIVQPMAKTGEAVKANRPPAWP